MVQQTQAEDAPVPEETAEQKPPEEEKFAAKPRAKRSEIDSLRSAKDREVAEANRGRTTAETERDEAMSKLASVEAHLDVTRKQANISDNEDERNKAFSEWQREASARDAKIHEHERTVTVTHLSQLYGIPADELEPFDTPLAMENAALKWRMSHPDESKPDTVEDEPDEAEEEKASDEEDDPKPPSRSDFDMGDGNSQVKSIQDMTDKEYDAYYRQLSAQSRNRQLRGGR